MSLQIFLIKSLHFGFKTPIPEMIMYLITNVVNIICITLPFYFIFLRINIGFMMSCNKQSHITINHILIFEYLLNFNKPDEFS